MDVLYIRDLRTEVIIGAFAWEREVLQTLRLDLDIAVDIGAAAGSDSLDDALNYKAVCARLIECAQGSRYALIEPLAEQLAQLVIDEFNVPWLRLKISKPGAVRHSADVGLIIERGAKPE
ncbi:MAG: dihydroneopterin aldolase [Gammaproteobacteria bacterium AqS3]|nr:dihydroneopterin aldolase [Gammaproteobacteria bacterium AqS3]